MGKGIVDFIPEITSIKDKDLRQKVINIWEEAVSLGGWDSPAEIPFNPDLGTAPSLINHTRSVTRIALFFAEEFERDYGKCVDRDMLATVAILHDVSKAVEIGPGPEGPAKSDLGKKVPHGIFGGYLAWKAGLPLDYIHLIITHTPRIGMLPARLEGIILAYADLLDADTHFYRGKVKTIMERHRFEE